MRGFRTSLAFTGNHAMLMGESMRTASTASAATTTLVVAGLTSSSHLFTANSTTCTVGTSTTTAITVHLQRRFRSAKFGIKGDEDRSTERTRNASNIHSNNRKKEDLYEFTGLSNKGSGGKQIPIGMDSHTAEDRNILSVNPMMILRKAEDDKGGKIVKAIKKIHGKPDSMRLTEEQQTDLVNAYAETRWYAVFWRPFSKINYTRARKFKLFANVGLCLCLMSMFTVMLTIYYQEMLNFCELDESEQVEYRHVIMNVPIGRVKAVGDGVMQKYDPNETLQPIERTRLILAELRKLGWTEMDWEVEAPRMFKAWYETFDYWHAIFWSSMWVGSICAGGGGYYSTKQTFGRIEQQATRRREEHRGREGFVSARGDGTGVVAQKPQRVGDNAAFFDGTSSFSAAGKGADTTNAVVVATSAATGGATKKGWLSFFSFGGDKKEEKKADA